MLEQFHHPVFTFFEQLCAIPHGSGNTKQISDFLVKFAKEHAFRSVCQDEWNNVIIEVDATDGCEQATPVILQGHMDMVCEQNAGRCFDFVNQGLSLLTDGEYIYADGTTLGGDDAIALAMALAIATDPAAVHPPLILMFTTDEEVGMEGAHHLDVSSIQAKRMINIDSEEEGTIICGCAGGVRSTCSIPVSFHPITEAGSLMRLSVGGLLGGHSGVDIHLERANANVILGRILGALAADLEIQLVSVCGGMMDNAIPRESEAIFFVPTNQEEDVRQTVCAQQRILKKEYDQTDPGLFAELTSVEDDASNTRVMTADATERVICFLLAAPNGVQHMSTQVEHLVETSLNMGIVHTNDTAVHITFALRSAVESRKEALSMKLKSLTRAVRGVYEQRASYPAWEYKADSPLRDLAVRVFSEQYGTTPKLEIIHAGLECGILAGKIPDLECISIGPDIDDIHTPKERLSVASTLRVYNYLCGLLAALACEDRQ